MTIGLVDEKSFWIFLQCLVVQVWWQSVEEWSVYQNIFGSCEAPVVSHKKFDDDRTLSKFLNFYFEVEICVGKQLNGCQRIRNFFSNIFSSILSLNCNGGMNLVLIKQKPLQFMQSLHNLLFCSDHLLFKIFRINIQQLIGTQLRPILIISIILTLVINLVLLSHQFLHQYLVCDEQELIFYSCHRRNIRQSSTISIVESLLVSLLVRC